MATHYSPRIITDGLVLIMDAGNVKSYPTTGIPWKDLSGNGNGGNLVGTTTFSTNPARFDTNVTNITTAGHLTTPTDITFADGTPYTFDFMVRLRSGAGATFQSLTGRGATNPWLTIFPTTTAALSWNVRYRQSGGTYILSSNIFYDLQTNWGNITLSVQSNREVKIYVNGEYKTSVFPTTTLFYVSRLAGGYTSDGNFYDWQGSIAMCKMYNRALDDGEIFQNFNAVRGRFGL
jgi:hypothetical protein